MRLMQVRAAADARDVRAPVRAQGLAAQGLAPAALATQSVGRARTRTEHSHVALNKGWILSPSPNDRSLASPCWGPPRFGLPALPASV